MTCFLSYEMLVAESPTLLSELVTRFMRVGWALHGSPFTVRFPGDNGNYDCWTYNQAVVWTGAVAAVRPTRATTVGQEIDSIIGKK